MDIPTITIDEEANVPIWVQIRNKIIFLVRSGQIPEGEKLPSVREMAVKLGINFNTVSRAYQELEREGFIYTKRGRGTFIKGVEAVREFDGSPLAAMVSELVYAAKANGVDEDELLYLVKEEMEKRRQADDG